jgi:ATP-binding cassette subfamily B (MDR/TAP) protein 1
MAMFRFANSFDYVLMAIGTICASAMGAALPAFALLWGSMTDSFGNNDSMVEAAK